MSVSPASELLDDYEMVVLPDGTQIPRERQTKAQVRIQALRAKSRNEKLRQTLMLISSEADNSSAPSIPKISTQENSAAITHHNPTSVCPIDTECAAEIPSPVNSQNELSAIQRQIIVNREKTIEEHERPDSNKEQQPKHSKFSVLDLKIVQRLKKQRA